MQPTCIYKEKELACTMTDAEFAAKSKEMLDWMNHIDEMQGKIDEVKSLYKDPIKSAEKKVEDLQAILNSKSIARKVKVARIYDWDKGITFERRCDNGEIVVGSTRKITDQEKQMDHTTEEQPAASEMLLGNEEAKKILALPAPAPEAQTEDAEFQVVDNDNQE